MSMLSAAGMDKVVPLDPFRSHVESLELAGKILCRSLQKDNSFPSLIELTQVAQGGTPTVSGLTEMDYPLIEGLSSVKQVKSINKVPLPREVMEHFGHMQCNCMMGLFTEIGRAWLTIDSDIYIWTYEHGSDLAYFDGLGETIVSIGLVKPKAGVFQNFVRYLLVLTTTVEIVVLGVSFSSTKDGPLGDLEEMHLLPEPVFALPTDGVTINTVSGTNSGRLFLGGRDGSLFEIVYKAEGSWFGKRCKKVNHSTSALSYLLPSFISGAFSEEDQIVHIAVDNSRNILYTLTEKGSISLYDLGEDGQSTRHIITTSQSTIVQNAVNIVRTLDSSIFKNIVSISSIEARESPHVNLVAVTKAGVRLYFTTSPVTSISPRPYALHLIHVRLPPGFAACALPQQPRNVNLAHYSRGTLILVTCPGGDRDVLWCLSSDAFPFHQYLAETQSVVPLDGVAWALAEVRPSHTYFDLPASFYQPPIVPCVENDPALSFSQMQEQQQQIDYSSIMDPPLVVRQHMSAPKKYVILTPQGAEIIAKLRPVDVLRQLLTDGRGPDTEAVKRFFREQREDQACATCLMLACLDSAQNAQIADWATRAFFLYGGEPRPVGSAGTGGGNVGTTVYSTHTPITGTSQLPTSPRIRSTSPTMPLGAHGGFNPGYVSTPIRAPSQQSVLREQTVGPASPLAQSFSASAPDTNIYGIYYSAKHDGLYLYMSRLLRPIWTLRTVHIAMIDKKQFLCSTLGREDCAWLLGHIHSLRSFLEKNAQFSVGYVQMNPQANVTADRSLHESYGSPLVRRPQPPVQQIQLQEKRSLDAFRVFIAHVCEVLGLWKILCEHQFHIIAETLTKELQNQLLNTTFQTLILIGHELCSVLINSLINSYLNDNASIDAISGRLRDVCPHLYRNEDAACSKAYEMLLSARSIQNKEEKETKLHSALQLCLKVAPQINLPLICQWFMVAQYYEGILDLCAVCAAKGDSKKLGEFYYKNGEPTGDEEGYRAYVERMECYKEIAAVLDHLYSQSLLNPYQPRIPLRPGAGVPDDDIQTSPADSENRMKKIIQMALSTKDELLHVAIYEWMLAKQLLEQLVAISEPSFERFLKHIAERRNEAKNYVNDLLWKYYEKNENHAEAAHILLNLATTASSSLNLNQRIAYLARAVMCMRSDKVGCAPHLGIVLQELEDKIDVAHVQQQILDRISSMPRTARTEEAMEKLNRSLIGCTELFENFADPFGLWDCKLAIVHCAGHLDAYLIEAIWRKIIETEIQSCGSIPPNDVMTVVMGKVKSLGQEYSASAICVPIGFLVKELELKCCRLRADPGQVHPVILSLGVSVLKLIQIYDTLVSETDQVWYKSGNEFHLIEVVGKLLEDFASNPQMVSVPERRVTVTRAADLMSKCLTFLYSKPNTQYLVDILRSTQSKLNRLSNIV